MRSSDKEGKRSKKIKEEKPKRQYKKDEDKQFDKDVELLMSLRRQREDMDQIVTRMEGRIQQKQQLSYLAQQMMNLQKSTVDIKMLESILQERNILPLESLEQQPQGFGYAVVSIRIRIGYIDDYQFQDDISESYSDDQSESQIQLNRYDQSFSHNTSQEISPLFLTITNNNQNHQQEQQSSSDSSESYRNS